MQYVSGLSVSLREDAMRRNHATLFPALQSEAGFVHLEQGCSRSIDLGGKDQDHLIELDLLW